MSRKEQIIRIRGLIDQYLEVLESQRNMQNMKLWKNPYSWNRDMWRGVPVKGSGQIPYTIASDNSLWAKILNISLVDYYNNPYTYMETQLKMKLYHFNHFNDNTPFTDELFIWFGVITELSMFGSEIVYYEHKEAWIKEPIIKEYEDAEKIAIPNFYKSGLMPKIHQYYEVMSELADGKLKVMFPDFARGPFCIVAHLRGLEKILMDMFLNPDFVHKMMRFLVDANKLWTEERNKFLGVEKHKSKLYNDEIDCPTLSPEVYREMIFPYEKELSEYHGGISYWHSCGNTTKFIETIGMLPNLELLHVGPWTSYKEADIVFGDKTALDICLNPQVDVLEADEVGMAQKLQNIMESCLHNNYTVRADGFMPHGDVESEIVQIKKWAAIAKKYLAQK